MDIKAKKSMMLQNIYLCKFGNLQMLPLMKPSKNNINNNFQFHDTNQFCEVYVMKNIHPIIIAKEYIFKKMNPIIMNVVKNDFSGTNIESSENMYDDILNLRTNFFKTINISGLYPLRGSEIVYSPTITVIRNENFIINPQEFFRINIITATPITEPKLEDESMNIDDYILTKEIIENIFQTALQTNHDVLILTDFGCRDEKNPINDIVDIFNSCILKYGSIFKNIIFSIAVKEISDDAIYHYFNKNIIKPQTLVENKEIENYTDLTINDKNVTPNQMINNNMIPNQIFNNMVPNQMINNNMVPNQMRNNNMVPNQMNNMMPNQMNNMIPNQMNNNMVSNQMKNNMVSNQMNNNMVPNQMNMIYN